MEDHAYSLYCRENYWQRCDSENLEVVEVLHESFDDDGSLAKKEAIYRCRLCGGFYKQIYRATYYPSHLFDTEEGWDISDKYFRIDEPRWKTPGSTLDVPLSLQEARQYGYAGGDRSWKNGRCNFPAQNMELTCRAGDLTFVADATPNAWDHLRNKLYKCRRCGEWYYFTPLPPFAQGFFKPSNELFPLDTARLYGYEEEKNLNFTNDESKAADEPGDARNSPYLSAGTSLRKGTVKSLRVIVQEALVLTPEFVRETPYKVNFFCRVPADWIENHALKAEFWKKIADQIFGDNWAAETFPTGHYIIKSSETEILDDSWVKAQNWNDFIETDDNLYYFFIGSENGEARKITAQEFQENVDAYFQNARDAAETASSKPAPEPEIPNELDASLAPAWNDPEKLPAANEWLRQGRSETAQAQYAYIILKKHFARANLELRQGWLPPPSWWSMGWALYYHIDALVREEKQTEMLKAMFIELVDFCESATGEYFACHLKELLGKLIDNRSERGKIKSLLPDKALNQFAEIDRMLDQEYEDYSDLMNQMGY